VSACFLSLILLSIGRQAGVLKPVTALGGPELVKYITNSSRKKCADVSSLFFLRVRDWNRAPFFLPSEIPASPNKGEAAECAEQNKNFRPGLSREIIKKEEEKKERTHAKGRKEKRKASREAAKNAKGEREKK